MTVGLMGRRVRKDKVTCGQLSCASSSCIRRENWQLTSSTMAPLLSDLSCEAKLARGSATLSFSYLQTFFGVFFVTEEVALMGKGFRFTSVILRKEVGQQERKQSSAVKEYLSPLPRWGEKRAFTSVINKNKLTSPIESCTCMVTFKNHDIHWDYGGSLPYLSKKIWILVLSYGRRSVTKPECSSEVGDPGENGLNAARLAGPRAAGSPSGFCTLVQGICPESSSIPINLPIAL